jgi:hypothetical protein
MASMAVNELGPMLTASEVADMLHLHVNTVKRLGDRGERVPRVWRGRCASDSRRRDGLARNRWCVRRSGDHSAPDRATALTGQRASADSAGASLSANVLPVRGTGPLGRLAPGSGPVGMWMKVGPGLMPGPDAHLLPVLTSRRFPPCRGPTSRGIPLAARSTSTSPRRSGPVTRSAQSGRTGQSRSVRWRRRRNSRAPARRSLDVDLIGRPFTSPAKTAPAEAQDNGSCETQPQILSCRAPSANTSCGRGRSRHWLSARVGATDQWDVVPWNSPQAPATPPLGESCTNADGLCRGSREVWCQGAPNRTSSPGIDSPRLVFCPG